MATRSLSLLSALVSFGAAAAEQLPSLPPPGAPLHWSISTGETVSPSSDAIALALGWPGARFDYLHGLSNSSDIGLRIELLYVEENTNNGKFGFGIGAPLRLVMARKDNLLLGVHVDPGLRVYTNSNQTDLYLRAPVGGILGIQATAQLRLAVAADLNLALQTQHGAFFEIGPSFGFGVDYLVDKSLMVGANARFGPQWITTTGTGADFAFTSEIVIGYRL